MNGAFNATKRIRPIGLEKVQDTHVIVLFGLSQVGSTTCVRDDLQRL
jgi:hypothetical protein